MRAQSRLVLCDPMNCSLPTSCVHGIFPARILEWVAISSTRGSSQPRDQTGVSYISCIAGRFFSAESPGKPLRISIWSSNSTGGDIFKGDEVTVLKMSASQCSWQRYSQKPRNENVLCSSTYKRIKKLLIFLRIYYRILISRLKLTYVFSFKVCFKSAFQRLCQCIFSGIYENA